MSIMRKNIHYVAKHLSKLSQKPVYEIEISRESLVRLFILKLLSCCNKPRHLPIFPCNCKNTHTHKPIRKWKTSVLGSSGLAMSHRI